jgi:hypothetical protein
MVLVSRLLTGAILSIGEEFMDEGEFSRRYGGACSARWKSSRCED